MLSAKIEVKLSMSMRKFRQELAGLLDKGWKAKVGTDGRVRLDPSGLGIIKLDPVMALACDKNNDRIPPGFEEACLILNLPFRTGLRIRAASNNCSEHAKTRWQLLRTLGLKPPTA